MTIHYALKSGPRYRLNTGSTSKRPLVVPIIGCSRGRIRLRPLARSCSSKGLCSVAAKSSRLRDAEYTRPRSVPSTPQLHATATVHRLSQHTCFPCRRMNVLHTGPPSKSDALRSASLHRVRMLLPLHVRAQTRCTIHARVGAVLKDLLMPFKLTLVTTTGPSIRSCPRCKSRDEGR